MNVRFLFLLLCFGSVAPCCIAEDVTLNQKADGFRGLWYNNQRLESEYRYKYSGGLGTYTAKHKPLAVYSSEVDKTFFCFGGVREGYHLNERLKEDKLGLAEPESGILHMIAAFDHKTGTIGRPTIILDKKTYDAHDNPVLSLDSEGYIWVFSTAHGRLRPSYIHRSVRPWDESEFEQVEAYRMENGKRVLIDNFSYFQVWHSKSQGFTFFFTLYSENGERKTFYANSRDGLLWENWVRLADIEKGHYQISGAFKDKAGSSFNYHPEPVGLNNRTNLYYVETQDRGKTWTNAAGETLKLPLTESHNPALVHDFEAEGLLVYMKDITFDDQGRPLILFITSRGFESGPGNDPRTWRLARWTGKQWQLSEITRSDSNYDMEEGTLRIIGPTEKGPQPYNPGGEVGMWLSADDGRTWSMKRQLTRNSPYNHTYVRRPLNANPGFYAFWADGHARQPSESRFYFSNRDGDVYQLPEKMDGDGVVPVLISNP
jgi:hypothetical protein